MTHTYDGPFGHWDVRRLAKDENVLGLIEALEYEKVRKSSGVRGDVVNELGKLGDSRAVEPLCSVLVEDSDISARRLAAKALGRLGDSSSVPVLLETLGDEDRPLQTWAMWSLGKLGARDSVDGLIERLRNKNDDGIRVFAARALGEIGDQRATFPLIEALGDHSRGVQREAAIALGKLGDSRALEPVLVAYENAGFFARRRIRRALVELESRFA